MVLNICIPNLFDPRAHPAFYLWLWCSYLGVRWPGRDADNLSSDEIKNGKDTKLVFG